MRQRTFTLLFFIGLLLPNIYGSTPMLFFETDSVWIKTDTSSLFPLITKSYYDNYAIQILKEIRHRIAKTSNDTIMLNGVNCHIHYDGDTTLYKVTALNRGEIYTLLLKNKAQVIYKISGQNIASIKIKKVGSKRKKLKERIFFDSKNRFIFLRQTLYEKSCDGPPKFI